MSRSRRARAARTGLNRDGPCSVGPRYGLAMRLNYLVLTDASVEDGGVVFGEDVVGL